MAQASLPHAAAHDAAESRQYLIFTLGGEHYAIGIFHIREIIEFARPTDVPMMPALIRGVINLRGSVVPVVDLSVRFGRAQTAVGRRSCIVIVEVAPDCAQSQVIGIMVDAVNEVIDIAGSDIEAAPAFGARIRSDFIRGMGKVGEEFVVMLELDHVLSVDELASVAQVTESMPPERTLLPAAA